MKCIHLDAIYNTKLPRNTITLPDSIYIKCMIDRSKFVLAHYPMAVGEIFKLSDLKVLISPSNCCELSVDLCKQLGVDVLLDTIAIIELEYLIEKG